MSQDKTILVVGTYDTKDDELNYMRDCIRGQGGNVLSMDISVLGDPSEPTDYSKHAVAEEGGSSIQAAIDSGDENTAMQIMARGAAMLALRLYREGKVDGVVVLGGTMGTSVLDVSGVKALAALPSLDELRAKLIGLLNAPATKIARTVKEPGGKLARVIQAKASAG